MASSRPCRKDDRDLVGESILEVEALAWHVAESRKAMRNLTVGKMMRRDVKSVSERMSLKEFRRLYPLGAATRVIALRDDDRHAGLIEVADAYGEAAADDATIVQTILRHPQTMLHPALGAGDAEALFEKNNADALVVVSDLAERKVIGLHRTGKGPRRPGTLEPMDCTSPSTIGASRTAGASDPE